MSDSGATERAREPTASRTAAEPEPDVLLDVPELSVDEIRLTVDGLDADLSLRARLANLLQLDAGVRVHLEGVELDITGVRAEALLKVRLEKLVQILDRALTTIDRNPQLIDALARSVGVTVDDVHRAAGRVAGPVVEEVAETGEVLDRTGPAAVDPLVRAAPSTGDRPADVPPEEVGPESGENAWPAGATPTHTADSGETVASATETGARGAAPAGATTTATGGGDGGIGRSGTGSGDGEPGRGQSPGVGAGQLAGQAGQALRQTGRSVWEAIQSGVRPQRAER
ncbi:hypothetical protein OG767_02260 [Micromonospora sp. NBC_01392]|uniref:hypothetical protein n=1 Tax=Micromonospora sp. NBC_01392 TaxID=2903588 RepID=UPI0032553753